MFSLICGTFKNVYPLHSATNIPKYDLRFPQCMTNACHLHNADLQLREGARCVSTQEGQQQQGKDMCGGVVFYEVLLKQCRTSWKLLDCANCCHYCQALKAEPMKRRVIQPLLQRQKAQSSQKRHGGNISKSRWSIPICWSCCTCCTGARTYNGWSWGGGWGRNLRNSCKTFLWVPFCWFSRGRNESPIWAMNKQRVKNRKCNLFIAA